MGMFEMFGQQKTDNTEERLINKQITAGQQTQIIANATDPNADMTYIHQEKEREDLIRWQQNLEYEMDLMEHDLKREYLGTDGEWKKMKEISTGEDGLQVEVNMAPACNDKCIQMIRTSVRPLLSRNMIMSNFTEERVLQMLKRTMASIVRNIGLQAEYYAINYFDISYITSTIKNYVIPAPFRAIGNGERKFLNTVNRRIETMSTGGLGDEQKKKGLLNIFNN